MIPDGHCPTIYGPLESRRHGRSLGINLGDPQRKICTWGCLYCQCGFGERRHPSRNDQVPSRPEIVDQLRSVLGSCGRIDSVTLAGNSEPCAHPEFLLVVQDLMRLKYAMRASWVLNCLSNGSELDRPDVRKGCDLLDEAWIKLDCATEASFRRLNRPIGEVGSVTEHVGRIAQLKKIRLQTLLWKSTAGDSTGNWTSENRNGLLDIYGRLKPIEIHLTTVEREPAWQKLEPVSAGGLEDFAREIRARGLSVKVFPEREQR